MDCPTLRFKNGFVDLTVQKRQREQPLEVWSTSSSELGMFVTRNVLRGRRRRRRKLWRPLWQAIEQSPKASTHRLSREHGITKSIVWQTLCFVLKKKTYHIQVLGLTQQHIYGPFFSEATITSTSYLDVLEQYLQPQLFANNILDLVVFQQDGALSHFAHIVRNYLNDTFPGRWIGRGSPRFWEARWRDLTPSDFFSWGHIMTHVNKVKIRDL